MFANNRKFIQFNEILSFCVVLVAEQNRTKFYSKTEVTNNMAYE